MTIAAGLTPGTLLNYVGLHIFTAKHHGPSTVALEVLCTERGAQYTTDIHVQAADFGL